MEPSLSGKKVLSSMETARMLGISVSSVRNWVRHGFIDSIASGNDYAFLVNDVITLRKRLEKGELARLKSRANKRNSSRTFLPGELLGSSISGKSVSFISDFIIESGIDRNTAMFMISLNLLNRKGLLEGAAPDQILSDNFVSVKSRGNLSSVINESKCSIMRHNPENVSLQLLDYDFPEDDNIAGAIYQSILIEGDKSRLGSYYTPDFIVDNITERLGENNNLFLDPCCGTGQFLLSIADKSDKPENLFGIDIDPVAVNVAKINLILKFRDKDFYPNIYCMDSLMDLDESLLFTRENKFPEFDIIATNPPWGYHYNRGEQEILKASYEEIRSGESFSYFIIRSMRMLKDNGVLCFVLPESFLNVKIHRDIREYILKNCAVERIEWGKRIFKNVFTNACIVDLKRTEKNKNQNILVVKDGKNYSIKQDRFKKNRDFNFDININPRDEDILNRVYSKPYTTLKGQADWALGIVTGNNSDFLSKEPLKGMEPVITGKDIYPFYVAEPSLFIRFERERFQQCSPEHIYRSRGKLVYKFISKKLIFALDEKGYVTLNSANILIPFKDLPPAKAVMALFNSDLYQFIFQKKFSSLKVLKSHIEELPIPLLSDKESEEFTALSDCAAKDGLKADLNSRVYKLFDISPADADYISEEIR